MKKFFLLLGLLAVFGFAVNSCSTTSGEKNDYFGYNNNPSAEEDETKYASQTRGANAGTEDAEWSNPLSDGTTEAKYGYTDSREEEQQTEEKTVVVHYKYYNTSPMYVPVVVPWWNVYYGWGYRPSPYRAYISYGPHWVDWGWWHWDWYSPRYSYHPYHGYYWPSHHHYGYYRWHHYPYHNYVVESKKVNRMNRNFGANRGTYTKVGSGVSPGDNARSSSRVGGVASTRTTGTKVSPDAVSSGSAARKSSLRTSTRKGMETAAVSQAGQSKVFKNYTVADSYVKSSPSVSTRTRTSGITNKGKTYKPVSTTRTPVKGLSRSGSTYKPSTSSSAYKFSVRSSAASSNRTRTSKPDNSGSVFKSSTKTSSYSSSSSRSSSYKPSSSGSSYKPSSRSSSRSSYKPSSRSGSSYKPSSSGSSSRSSGARKSSVGSSSSSSKSSGSKSSGSSSSGSRKSKRR